jgi:hypothetical protein
MATLVSQHSYTGDIGLPASSKPFALPFDFVKGDGDSHQFNVTVQNTGEDVSLSGATCLYKIFRTADGATVSIAADVDGSVMSKTFSAECTAYAMPIYIMAVVTSGTIERTVWYASARVRDGASDVVVDPGSAVPSLGEMLAQIAACEDATAAATAAAAAITGITAEATTLETGEPATAEAEIDPEDGHINLVLGLPKGNPGATGAAIESVAFSGDDMVFTRDDEVEITLADAKNDLKGDQGETGAAFSILGTYADLTALRAAVPSPPVGVFYNVGAATPYSVYRSTGLENPDDWEDQGTLQATTDAADMDILDSGDYYTSDNVESALQEVGKATAVASTSADGLSPQATAPGAGLQNVLAIRNGETAHSDKSLFDATNPSTQAFGDSATPGTAMTAARRDHKHAMPAEPTPAGIGAQAKATITENTDAAPALGTIANNTEYRCTHGTPTDAPTMTIAAIAANTTEFACNVIYKAEASGAAAPAVTNNSGKTIKYQGDGVAAGTFTPVAGTVYRLGWVWDGLYLNCYIKGV